MPCENGPKRYEVSISGIISCQRDFDEFKGDGDDKMAKFSFRNTFHKFQDFKAPYWRHH